MAVTEQVKRRVRAGRLLQKGVSITEVAREVGATRQTIYNWQAILEEQGLDGLREVDAGGRPGKLSDANFESLRSALLKGAGAHGFGSDLWTLKRVRQLIERQFKVRYSEVHVWRLLGRLGFSSQKPERRALERDEAAIERWKKQRWPALKKSTARRPSHSICG
jgi:transposase